MCLFTITLYTLPKMNSPHILGLCAAGAHAFSILEKLESMLKEGGWMPEPGDMPADAIGSLFIVSKDSDLEWLEGKLLRAKNAGMYSMVIWGSPALPTRLAVWQWLLQGADYVCHYGNDVQANDKIICKLKRWTAIGEALSAPWVYDQLAGAAPCWISTLRQLAEMSMYSTAPVLIMGESGTGKEMAARLIHHFNKQTTSSNLTLLDCSAIVPELSGSEFFGHERGAFTNAVYAREGAFATADQGSLFLDE
ncbi:MAG TPA: hypothetical protein DCF33_11675, partial [Saprospirales bacterium]|nr:hypothetical protein [Saprospirales bacterium]